MTNWSLYHKIKQIYKQIMFIQHYNGLILWLYTKAYKNVNFIYENPDNITKCAFLK